jgi:hypothetical protein
VGRIDGKSEDGEGENPEQDIRDELYEQFGVSKVEKLIIRYLLSVLNSQVKRVSQYDVDTQSKVLAEIALYRAYNRVPKFKLIIWGLILTGMYDLLYTFDPSFYPIVLGALVTYNGFVSSLRTPEMIAAELKRVTDNQGMPADYREKARSSANTSVSIVLFTIVVGVQLLVTSSVIQGEIFPQNTLRATVSPIVSAVVLFSIPLLTSFVQRRR